MFFFGIKSPKESAKGVCGKRNSSFQLDKNQGLEIPNLSKLHISRIGHGAGFVWIPLRMSNMGGMFFC